MEMSAQMSGTHLHHSTYFFLMRYIPFNCCDIQLSGTLILEPIVPTPNGQINVRLMFAANNGTKHVNMRIMHIKSDNEK